MKNIQVIDDAINCTYDIFKVEESDFYEIFPDGNDIEFEDDLFNRLGDKKALKGIHGTLFFGYCCEDKRPFYPTKKESEMIANP